MIIGLDVGGTHTDVVLLDQEGLKKEIKVPTDAVNLFQSVLTGLEAITAGIDPQQINRIVLSTTLTTNAIVQDKVPPVGMLISGGPGIDPECHRIGSHYFTVTGAIDHRGREVHPLQPDKIRELGSRLQDEGIRYLGVVGKFSIRNPVHELAIERLLEPAFDKIFLGHRISGNLNFARRIATTYLNAAVYPLHRQFYQAVQESLAAKGLVLPIRLLKADGGNMKFESSIEIPIQTILSGPAASVMGALAFGSPGKDTLVMDIGGTTTDIAVLIDRAPALDPLGIELASYKTLIRSLETLSIGVGGDSAVRAADGAVRVGPDRQGPAMIYGGAAPTPTDALAVLGSADPAERNVAVAGLTPLARQLGVTVEAASEAIVRTACDAIISAAQRLVRRINGKPVYTVHELQEGYQVRPSEILVLGGPAPQFAEHLQARSGQPVRVVPRWQVANAIGAALARTTCEVNLFADTEKQTATAPEENFTVPIGAEFDSNGAVEMAFELLRKKAVERGANPAFLEMEVIENMQFNMVRGFYTTGRNLRVRVQVKPGLIHGYDELLANLAGGQT
jgi:N-methylhydantoinase A/oxoprolinase/acetone carboxylase beta subunit